MFTMVFGQFPVEKMRFFSLCIIIVSAREKKIWRNNYGYKRAYKICILYRRRCDDLLLPWLDNLVSFSSPAHNNIISVAECSLVV